MTAILEAGGSKLRTQKAKVQQITEELDAATSAITKIQVNAESFQKHMKTSQKALSEAEAEKKEVQEAMEQLKIDLKQLEDDAVKVSVNGGHNLLRFCVFLRGGLIRHGM